MENYRKLSRLKIVLIHGLNSSRTTWARLRELASTDEDLAEHVEFLDFEYSTPRRPLRPTRRAPDVNTIADALATFLELRTAPGDDVLIVAHSLGGLIAQRCVVRSVSGRRSDVVRRVRGLVMYATPNAGSQFLLAARRAVVRRPSQEWDLRPLAEAVSDTLREFLQIVAEPWSGGLRIAVTAYAGETDGIVPPASARSVFPSTGVLPGDHFSIIEPESHEDVRYRSFAQAVLQVATGTAMAPVVASEQRRSTSPEQARAEITLAISRIGEFQDSVSRYVLLDAYLLDDVFRRLPTQPGLKSRTYISALVRECDRFGEKGRLALLATLELGFSEDEDPAVVAAVETIRRVWALPPND